MANRRKDPWRILLIGRTGDGKSSTGNTILGRDDFETSRYATSQTKTSLLKSSEWDGRPVEVVDTPGIFDTDNGHSHLPVLKELIRALLITMPGFHVIAFVLKPGKFTPEVQRTMDKFFEWFGQGVEKHACVILTHTDSAETMKDFLENKTHPKLTALVRKCCDRVVCLDNNGTPELKRSQLHELFKMVNHINAQNDEKCFTNIAYKLAQIYANSLDGKKISDGSIILLRNAGLPWPAEYFEAGENAVSSMFSGIDENTTPKSTSVKGNLTIIDENDRRIPNTVPVCTSPDSVREKVFEHNDQVGGRSGRIDFGPAVSDYDDQTAQSIDVTDQDDTSSLLSSEIARSNVDDNYNEEGASGGHIDTDNVHVVAPDNVGENETGKRYPRRSGGRSRKIDYDSIRENVPVGSSIDRGVSRRGRNVDMTSIEVDVPVHNDQRPIIAQDENATTSVEIDQNRNFRQNANDNDTTTTWFMRFALKIRNKFCCTIL